MPINVKYDGYINYLNNSYYVLVPNSNINLYNPIEYSSIDNDKHKFLDYSIEYFKFDTDNLPHPSKLDIF